MATFSTAPKLRMPTVTDVLLRTTARQQLSFCSDPDWRRHRARAEFWRAFRQYRTLTQARARRAMELEHVGEGRA